MAKEGAPVPITGEYLPSGDVVDEGRQAWGRIKQGVRMMREDWLKVGEALAVGRREHPSNQAFGKWCAENGFGDIDRRLRADAMWLLENESVVVKTDNGITDNNPTNIRSAYRKREKVVRRSEAQSSGLADAPCELADLENCTQQFGTIYADPPWQYGNQATRAATGNHYRGMTVDEICDMPIQPLAADVSHLHLWTTNGFLPDAFRVIEAWGFEYKSCFVWVKPQMGIGNYWRVSHEFLLLGTRGACPFADKSLMSWASLGRTKHSAKPDEIRRMIEKGSPGPRLELFARRLASGWVSWGNEIERTMFEQGMACGRL